MILRNTSLHEEVVCSNCGKLWERRWMEEFNTGRRTQHICPDCYRKASMDIYAARAGRVERMNKKSRKR